MKVLMMPNPLNADSYAASGITSVLRDYAQHAPDVGVEFVDEHAASFDVLAVHAGMSNFYTDGPYVAHCHGLYWTGDYTANKWEYKANRDVISSLRRADIVTVPSEWVAHSLRRDMHIDPIILPHGIDPAGWQSKPIARKYVLWNKNRDGDVCNPAAVRDLARLFPDVHFLATFAPKDTTPNVLVTGTMPHSEMRDVIMAAHIYLSTTKETFGIGMLEARASGVPILAYAEGGAVDIVQHGVDGYLAKPGNIADLAKGLAYCLEHHDILSHNALQNAHLHTWPQVMHQLVTVYQQAIDRKASLREGVSVVIPCYNYAVHLGRAVESVIKQTLPADKIIIVDDGSTDDTPKIAEQLLELYSGKIHYIRTENRGVAHARNTGMAAVATVYACCLDADDEMAPDFLAVCVRALARDPELGLAYTKLMAVSSDGSRRVSDWPGAYNFNGFLKRQNQVPTCCVFRTDIFRRAGGYRQRYAPTGAGSEDANLWLRMGALGYGGILASEEALFHYHLGGRVSNDQSYTEVDWLEPYFWTVDKLHPFASVAQSIELSHPVYQRDTPQISVVIPCSSNHLAILCDAVDSVEGQSYRAWELIVVFDGIVDLSYLEAFQTAYPFVRVIVSQTEVKGAGWARNQGAQIAKAPYLVFLDADDWLDMRCLERMYEEMRQERSIIYTDYIGHAQLDKADARKLGNRLLTHDERTGMATIRHFASDYDCDLAQQQPRMNGRGEFYIWNIITSLVPRKWHEEVGGFDEKMQSWEDWDYWIRLARLGKCFQHLDEPLVHYRFYSGQRREIGRQQHADLLDYMQGKYQEIEIMPCSGCRGRNAKMRGVGATAQRSLATLGDMTMANEDQVLVELVDGNRAKHPISMRGSDNQVYKYGYRQHGERFYIRREHAESYRHKFKLVEEPQNVDDIHVDEDDDELSVVGPTPLKVFTASDQDKGVAIAERDDRVAPKPKPRAQRTTTRRTKRTASK